MSAFDSPLPPIGPDAVRASVLVAEDNPANQKVAKLFLERLGCRVDVAADGQETIEAWSRGRYDLIFMDCQMPEMDGFEAAQAIRREEQPGERIPIIALTANAFAGEHERCLAAGMDDYLAKPIRPDALAELLNRWQRPTPQTVI